MNYALNIKIDQWKLHTVPEYKLIIFWGEQSLINIIEIEKKESMVNKNLLLLKVLITRFSSRPNIQPPAAAMQFKRVEIGALVGDHHETKQPPLLTLIRHVLLLGKHIISFALKTSFHYSHTVL